MGHYYADMMCDTCSNIRCTCPPKPDTDHKRWMVHPQSLVVMRVSEFDAEASKNKNGWTPVLFRMGSKAFDKKEDAIAHEKELRAKLIASLYENLEATKARIKELER